MSIFKQIPAKFLVAGAVGIIPTDTIYGLAARAADEGAVARLYALKYREGKPGTIIAADIQQLAELGIKQRYLKAVEQFWPGAVSVVVPAADSRLVYLHEGKQSLAVRIPDDTELLELLRQTGPLLTSSANHPGESTANTVAEAEAYFGHKVDFYVDGGSLANHKPSTIIRVVDDAIEVIRAGTVPINDSGGIT